MNETSKVVDRATSKKRPHPIVSCAELHGLFYVKDGKLYNRHQRGPTAPRNGRAGMEKTIEGELRRTIKLYGQYYFEEDIIYKMSTGLMKIFTSTSVKKTTRMISR